MAEWVDGELPREFLVDFMDRLHYATEQQEAFMRDVRLHYEKHRVTLEGEVGPLGVGAVIRARVPEDPIPPRWKDRLGDILTNYRATLDSFAFTLANLPRDTPMSEKEAAQVSYPLMKAEVEWNRLVRKGWLRALPPVMIERIRMMQPFLLPDPEESILLWLHDIDRVRKHRWSLSVFATLDPQWPHIFFAVGGDGKRIQISPDGITRENIGVPLADGQIVYRLGLPVRATRVFCDHRAQIAAWVSKGGDGVDLQDLLFAVNLKLQLAFQSMWNPRKILEHPGLENFNKPPGFEGRWGMTLDDPGHQFSVLVRQRNAPAKPFKFTARSDEDITIALSRALTEFEEREGRPFEHMGYAGPVEFVNVYYPDDKSGPVGETLRARFLPDETVYDLRRLFGDDLKADPPVIEMEFNTGRGGGGLLEILADSAQVTAILLEVYGTYEAGRKGIEYISKRIRSAPFDAIPEWAASGLVPDRLVEYLQTYREWHPIDLQRQFEVSATEAVALLEASGFYSPEASGTHWIRTYPRTN